MAEEVATATVGPNGKFPAELNGWNWGAFFLNWIWGIGNSVWIALLALLGPVALIMAIILGIKGNEWAWNSRKFASVEEFKQVQKAWTKWGVIVFIIEIVLWVVMMIAGVGLISWGIKNADTTTTTTTTETTSFFDETSVTP